MTRHRSVAIISTRTTVSDLSIDAGFCVRPPIVPRLVSSFVLAAVEALAAVSGRATPDTTTPSPQFTVALVRHCCDHRDTIPIARLTPAVQSKRCFEATLL